MNKTLIKNFAIDARVRLIQMAIDNAGLVGIAKDKIDSPIQKGDNFEIYKTLAGTEHTITGAEIKQRESLVNRIKKDGFENVMEAAAYTWFNRIIAIRYMEVNDYLPTRVRVLSSETAGKKEPDIITLAPDNVDLNFTEAEKQQIRKLKAKQKMDEVFQLLFIKQCNELNKYLPKLFEKTSAGELDYTELLFSLSFIQTDGVVARLLEIDEEDFKDQVQIIGWMYQYYNTELKDDTFAKLKKNVKITKERIPAATQLFTPDWIVRYMVENSLGRLYAQSNTAQSEEQTAQMMGWKYYLPEAEQTDEVQKKLAQIRQEQIANFNLENIKVLDPCMGSGHILVYAFDVLIQMYKNAGYNERDAALKIMQNNIYGLDIDDRAAQLTYFALMMKGRQYDRRFFERDVKPNTYAIQESNGISEISIKKVISESAETSIANYLINTFHNAKEYGSIIDVESKDYDSLKNTFLTWKKNHDATLENVLVETDVDDLIPLCQIAKVMSAKYDVVVTNPPYMGSGGMSERLLNYVKKSFDDGRNDLYTVFILKCQQFCKINGLIAMITQLGWLTLIRSFQLRNTIYKKCYYENFVHLGSRTFEELSGEVVKSASFVFRNSTNPDFIGLFCKLDGIENNEQREEYLVNKKNLYTASISDFFKIQGAPLSYWLPKNMLSLFKSNTIDSRFICRAGMQTGNNDLFLRFWYEPSKEEVSHFVHNKKWFSYNKGGTQRKWYGNLDLVVNWENNGRDIKAFKKHRLELGEIEKKNSECWNSEFYFVEGITWSSISSGAPMFRYTSNEAIFDIKGPTCFRKEATPHDELINIMGFLNSPISICLLNVLSPTLDCNPGTVSRLPYINIEKNKVVNSLVEQNISLSKSDWDSFETSWDFEKHPLI